MSADNWRECPKCKAVAVARQKAKLAKVAESYGKVPAEEWTAMKAKADKLPEFEQTLREDYSIGVYEHQDGVARFSVHYTGACTACSFLHEFERVEELKL